MPFNGSGTYSLPAGNPVVSGTQISSTTQNTTMSDVANALSTTITKNGQTAITANIPFSNFKITGLGAGTLVGDAVNVSQLQNNDTTTLSGVAGTNTITANATPTPSAYVSGQEFTFSPANTNTAATTINISGLGAKNILSNGAALVASALAVSQPVKIRYNGTSFDIIARGDIATLNVASQTFTGAMTVSGALTTSTTTVNGALSYTSTLTGGTAAINIGSGQIQKDTTGTFSLSVSPSPWSSAGAFEVPDNIGINAKGRMRLFANIYDNSGLKYSTSAFGTAYIQSSVDGSHRWFTAPSGTATNAATLTERLTMSVSGNISCGTTTLDVARLYTATTVAGVDNLKFADENTSNAPGIKAVTNALTFKTSGSERVRLSANGNLSVGTTVVDAARLYTATTVAGVDNLSFADENTTSASGIKAVTDALTFKTQGTEKGRFAGGGNFLIGTTTDNGEILQANGAARVTGNLLFNSGYGSAAVAYGCRAWVRFNGTGTVAINASGNVSSITDNGVGDYTINFNTALPDANYSATLMVTGNGAGMQAGVNISSAAIGSAPTTMTTSALRINTGQTSGGANQDAHTVCAAIFR